MTRLAVLDLETSGLDVEHDAILQVAIVFLDGPSASSREWSSYVRPRRRFTDSLGPTHIHGITRRQVVFAHSEKWAVRRVAELTSGCVVVAHNAAFDMGFLRAAARRHGVEYSWVGSLCTLALSRRRAGTAQRSHKLTSLCEEFAVPFPRAHHALHDARAAAGVLPHLLGALGATTEADLMRYVMR